MKVRYKGKHEGFSGNFNTHGIGEAIMYFDDGADSVFISDLEVLLPNNEWKPLNDAFKDKDVINDNYNTRFFFPPTPEDRERGYTLY
jgi:hypothetical protein